MLTALSICNDWSLLWPTEPVDDECTPTRRKEEPNVGHGVTREKTQRDSERERESKREREREYLTAISNSNPYLSVPLEGRWRTLGQGGVR